MANRNPTDCGSGDQASPAAEDAKTERTLLALVLHEHPSRLTADELALVLSADAQVGNPDEATKRAVTELVAAGLLHRDGPFLVPTRPALYFARLEED